MDFIVVQLAILFLPGLIWARLDSRYAMKEKPGEMELLIRAFMFGLATYAFVFMIYWCLAWEFSSLGAPTDATPVLAIDAFVDEILISLPLSLLLSTVWIAATNKKWLTRFLQWIGATRRYGDEDVWDFTLNSGVPQVEYVHLRDFDKSIVYAGYVRTYSESGRLRELVLDDVIVYDFAGKEMAKVPRMYVARDPQDIHLEFPYVREKTR